MACCTNNDRFNRPKAAQYTSKRQDDSPLDDHPHKVFAKPATGEAWDDTWSRSRPATSRKQDYSSRCPSRLPAAQHCY